VHRDALFHRHKIAVAQCPVHDTAQRASWSRSNRYGCSTVSRRY
jgi:hypothetical protein